MSQWLGPCWGILIVEGLHWETEQQKTGQSYSVFCGLQNKELTRGVIESRLG